MGCQAIKPWNKNGGVQGMHAFGIVVWKRDMACFQRHDKKDEPAAYGMAKDHAD